MDYSKVPDILAITSLACAFYSILRRNRNAVHHLWLFGWVFIVIHLLGFMVSRIPGMTGLLGTLVGQFSLVGAGICFMWATVPTERQVNSRHMAAIIFLTTSLYILLACMPNVPGWAYDSSASLIALGPLTIGLIYRRYSQHALRWLTVGFQFALGAELMVLRRQASSDPSLGINAILFVIYMGCCVYFWYSHQGGTTGSFITIGGFLAWAMVFPIAPFIEHYFTSLRVENEVWNLPKYIVAVGMLLLLLEEQIERTQYLALHDDLTELANRRLFKDRLSGALERTRRSGTSMALLQIDLDGFKEVNDTNGHHVGDLLLQHVSQLLGSRIRRSDTVARTGGDEFSLILEEPSRREDAEQVAESLSRRLREPFEVGGIQIQVDASIGIALYPDDAHDAESLCIVADLRMYEAKEEHKRENRTFGQHGRTNAAHESLAV